MDREDIRERVAALPDNQLVLWLFTFERMAQIETRLSNLETGYFTGRRPPNPELSVYQEHLQMELKSRTQAKGGT